MVELYFEKPESRVGLKPGALSGIGIETEGTVLSERSSVVDLCVRFLRFRLRIPRKLPEVASLVRELRSMRPDTTERGRKRMNAHGMEHDDLVMAVALACWHASQLTIGLRNFQL